MNITVKLKDVYGVQKIYPACDTSEKFAALAGTKTLTREALAIIKSMGYAVQVQSITVEV